MVKLNDIPDAPKFEPLEIGWYHVKVVGCPLVTPEDPAKSKYADMKLQVVEGKDSERFIFKRMYLSSKALMFLKPFLMAIKFPENVDIDLDEPHRQWMGKELMVYVSKEEYKGTDKQTGDQVMKVRDAVTSYATLESHGKSEVGGPTPDKLPTGIPF